MNPRLKSLLAFLTALGAAVAPALIDPQQTLAGKLAVIAVTALLLGVKTETLATQRNAILGGLALAGAVVAGVLGKFSPGTAGFAVVGCVAAVIAQMRVLIAAKLPETAGKSGGGLPPVASVLALSAGLGLLGYAVPARADINLDDIAPRLTKCWGSTCLQPAASVNAVMFDLSAKKWMAGTTSLGAGLELLFAADQAYGSGLIAHLTGVISQQGPSFAMPTIGVVLFRYAELGYSYRVASDAPNASYVSGSLTLPWDLLATGKSLPVRAAAARAARAAQPGDDLRGGP